MMETFGPNSLLLDVLKDTFSPENWTFYYLLELLKNGKKPGVEMVVFILGKYFRLLAKAKRLKAEH